MYKSLLYAWDFEKRRWKVINCEDCVIRKDNRKNNELRNISIVKNINMHAEGSCLVKFGNTQVICTASFSNTVPRFLKGSGKGWVSAEYFMLPRSTNSRINREKTLKGGRTLEIQRLIGRSLRSSLDLKILGEKQILIDCDVIQADGGTRTASITGGMVALLLCVKKMLNEKKISRNPIIRNVSAVSCGIVKNNIMLDLNYEEDSNASTDMNFVFSSEINAENNNELGIIEMQGTAEKNTFSKIEMDKMHEYALEGCKELFLKQQKIIDN